MELNWVYIDLVRSPAEFSKGLLRKAVIEKPSQPWGLSMGTLIDCINNKGMQAITLWQPSKDVDSHIVEEQLDSKVRCFRADS